MRIPDAPYIRYAEQFGTDYTSACRDGSWYRRGCALLPEEDYEEEKYEEEDEDDVSEDGLPE